MKKLLTLPGLFCAVFLFTHAAFAQQCIEFPKPRFTKEETDLAKTYPGYFTVEPGSVRITLLGISEEPDMGYIKLQEELRDLNGILVSIEKIVNIAEKLWKIVEANKPVVNLDTKYSTAYPEGVTSASQLSSWSRPKVYTYGFYAKNTYGSVMIDTRYKVMYSYGGSYKGKGKYLTGVTVVPNKVEVGFGYKFYMSASVPDSTVTNVGSSEVPLAAMQLKLAWKMATVLKESDGTSVYYIQGDGLFEEIASPFMPKEAKLEDLRSAAPLLAPETVFK